MPLTVPVISDRKYQDLLDEALARIPVHNPEWTNFNRSDPGVTLVELFAFLTENLLYRSNLIPERNRLKFLSLLGVPLQPASSARGLVQFTNERGPLQTFTLNSGLEVRAGQVPFRLEQGLDVLPVEAQVFYKRRLDATTEPVREYYRQLYASFDAQQSGQVKLQLYQTTPLTSREGDMVDLGSDAVDGSLWIALMLRAGDVPYAARIEDAREAIAGKTLSLGVVPALVDASRRLTPGGRADTEAETHLQYWLPKLPPGGDLEKDETGAPRPRYQRLIAASTVDVLTEPGVVQLTLPAASELRLWNNLEPLEAGVGDLPPALEDTDLQERLVTWIRLHGGARAQARLLWAGVNTTSVTQRAHVATELLPSGTGEPDQTATLANTPVIPGSVRVTVTAQGKSTVWTETDDLLSAGPEVPAPDPRESPSARPAPAGPTDVFALDPESGELRFGDGTRGRRPPQGATIRAEYDYGMGAAGNVGAGSINTGAALPAGLRVTNPVRTWGGSRAETAAEGERLIPRYLQHHDRLVSAADFEAITLRTPGVEIGRVEVIPAFNPDLVPNVSGDAPGAVTLLVIPRFDPAQPDAPSPDRLFINAVSRHLDPRRLVTTEVILRGPVYKGIWVSIGLNVVAGVSVAQVREEVRASIMRFLSPLPADPSTVLERPDETTPQYAMRRRGWPLETAVTDRELMAEANRVRGVLSVNDVLVAEGAKAPEPQIRMNGLELPRVLGLSITVGDPMNLDELRGIASGAAGGGGTGTGGADTFLPVPVIPEEC